MENTKRKNSNERTSDEALSRLVSYFDEQKLPNQMNDPPNS